MSPHWIISRSNLDRSPELRRFVYDFDNEELAIGGLDREEVLIPLILHTTENLEYLRFTGRVNRIMYACPDDIYDKSTLETFDERFSLKGFVRLKQAHLSLDLFIGVAKPIYERPDQESWDPMLHEWADVVLPLSKCLSSATEELVLSVRDPVWAYKVDDLLRDLIVDPAASAKVPSLKSVVFECETFTDVDIDRLTECWRPRGVRMGKRITFGRT